MIKKANHPILLLLLFGCLISSIHSTVDIHIKVVYPQNQLNGKQIYIRGDFTPLNWTKGIPLQNIGDDTFGITLSPDVSHISNPTLSFKTLVGDNIWQIGQNVKIQTHLIKSDNTYTIYPYYFTHTGKIELRDCLHSIALNNSRHVITYFPPSYYENPHKRPYDTIIMHDGQNLFFDNTSAIGIAWKIQNTLNELINEGRMREVIIAGLYNTADRNNDYTYSFDPTVGFGGDGNLYLDFIEDKVFPYLHTNFPRMNLKPDSLGMIGSSLGGLISCYAGYTRPNKYAKIGCMSSSFWWNSQDFLHAVMQSHSAPYNKVQIYLDSGNEGPGKDDVTETIAVREKMIAQGYVLNQTVYYYLDPGGRHNEYFWGKRFHVPMTDLYPPVFTPPH